MSDEVDDGDEVRRALVTEARRLLDVRRLVLVLHEGSFPAARDDVGHGTPYAHGGLLAWVASLGFDGVQLGPQGQVSPGDHSPYGGALWSRNALAIALGPLARDPAWGGVLSEATLDRLAAARPSQAATHVDHAYAWRAIDHALDEVQAALRAGRGAGGRTLVGLEAYRRAQTSWLEREAVFVALSTEHGTDDWTRWPVTDQVWPSPARRDLVLLRQQAIVDRHALAQFILVEQHGDLRRAAPALGLSLYGDLQIGVSHRDRWAPPDDRFLPGYALGAPPSRTNPAGQPWGYPVYDPSSYRSPSGALAVLGARVDRLFTDFDGLRIDHPHGLICPWVYRTDDGPGQEAVATGARLFASPDLPDHPRLAGYAIARPQQLDRAERRWADRWERELDAEQIDRYAVLLDAIVERALAHGRRRDDLVCEVLSTCPYPLGRVLSRHGLGRMRVTQKADPHDRADVYRTSNAAPEDWCMLGNHDTPPIWGLVERWRAAGVMQDRAADLAERLCPEAAGRADFAAELVRRPSHLVEAMLADLFACPARNVAIFFPDLLGITEVYNRPGVVDDANWRLRVPPDWAAVYPARCGDERALSLTRALAMALRARGLSRELAVRLDALG
jgi:4-alpha-glucanotransferase